MRALILAFTIVAAGPALAATIAKPVEVSQCSRELASVDRSFAAAMLDLQRNADPANRCSA